MNKAIRRALIDNFTIAKPCGIDWDTMTGDDKVRLCGLCDRNVHNISGMSERGAARLIERSKSERLCIYYRRNADGTVHIDNCPEMLKPVRNRVYAMIAALLVCTIVGIRYSASCTIALNCPIVWPLVPFFVVHDAYFDIADSLQKTLVQCDPNLKMFDGEVLKYFSIAIAQAVFFVINILVFFAPINRERKRSFRRSLAGLLVAFGGPALVHQLGTFLTNNFGSLGGGI